MLRMSVTISQLMTKTYSFTDVAEQGSMYVHS